MAVWRSLILGNGKNQTRKNVVWNMIGSIIFSLASVILFAAATRATGEYFGGIFSIAFTTGQMLLTISYYEVRPFQVTDVSYEYGFHEYLTARVITSFAMVAAGLVYLAVTRPDRTKAAVILLMCFFKLMDGVADVFEGEFHRRGRLDISGKSMAFRTTLSCIVFIAAVVWSRDIIVASAAAVAAAVIGFALFDLAIAGEFEKLKLSREWNKVFKLLKDCFCLFLGSFLYIYICNAVKYAIDARMGAEMVTYYTDIYMPVSIINLLSGFVFKPLLTEMGERYKNGELKRLRKTMATLIAGVAILTVICCLGAYLIGIPVLELIFGHDLSGYRRELVILILGGGFNAAAVLLYYMLTIMRVQKRILACYIAAAVAAVVLSSVMVGRAGITGGALCYTFVMGILAVLFFVNVCLKYHRVREKEQITA